MFKNFSKRSAVLFGQCLLKKSSHDALFDTHLIIGTLEEPVAGAGAGAEACLEAGVGVGA